MLRLVVQHLACLRRLDDMAGGSSPVERQDAFEVVELMLDDPCGKAFKIEDHGLAMAVEVFDADLV